MTQIAYYPRAVVFDMDGLLVDTEPLWAEVEASLLQSYGISHNRELIKPFVGMRMDEFWTNVCRTLEIPAEPAHLTTEVVEAMIETIGLRATTRPGALELIDYLKEKQIPCAIASSSPKRIIETVVHQFGWDDFFRARVSGDEVAQGKPAPDVYLEAARQIGAVPSQTLALEDSANGSRAAVAAGMMCFVVPDLSHGHPSDFTDISPYLFESLHGVLDVLRAAETNPQFAIKDV